MTLDNTVPHLNHFCSRLSPVQYVSVAPVYSFDRRTSSQVVTCTVTLPTGIGLSSRTFTSGPWRSERLARQDAAFEACSNLHQDGLINDNLMPLEVIDEEAQRVYSSIERREGLVAADAPWNPLAALATSWSSRGQIYTSTVTIRAETYTIEPVVAVLPFKLENIPKLTLHLDEKTHVTVSINDGKLATLSSKEVQLAGQATRAIFQSVFGSRMHHVQDDFPVLFTPYLNELQLHGWLESITGSVSAGTLPFGSHDILSTFTGLVRRKGSEMAPFVLKFVEEAESIDGESVETHMILHVWKIPKNFDLRFMHRPHTDTLVAKDCSVDRLPALFAQVARMLPSIMDHIAIAMTLSHFCDTELKEVPFADRQLVLRSIAAPAYSKQFNYQRFEYLGDNLLKTYVSVVAMEKNRSKHEGYLSHFKDHMVANQTLAVIAKRLHLDRYILNEANRLRATGWRPIYNSTLLSCKHSSERTISTKTLADTIEALLGAAYFDGGETRLLDALSLFFPHEAWRPLKDCFATMAAETDAWAPPCTTALSHAAELLAHDFNNIGLLFQALTHPSHLSSNISYQRLEYLGDSILDYIVTRTMFQHSAELSPGRMTSIKFATVNAHLLAFLVLSTHIQIPISELVGRQGIVFGRPPVTRPSVTSLTLLDLMRSSPDFSRNAPLALARSRFAENQSEITAALRYGKLFPWRQLSSLEVPKCVSDLLESSLGALAIDARGDLEPCERWLEKLGLLPLLRRILANGIDIRSPKSIFYSLAHPKDAVLVLHSDRVQTESSTTGDHPAVADNGLLEDPVTMLLGSGVVNAPTKISRAQFRCEARIESWRICTCEGPDKATAIFKAAEEAVRILRARGYAEDPRIDWFSSTAAARLTDTHGADIENEITTLENSQTIVSEAQNDDAGPGLEGPSVVDSGSDEDHNESSKAETMDWKADGNGDEDNGCQRLD